MKLELSRQISEKILKYQNFVIIRPMGAELFQADGRTDKMKLTATLSQFCEHASKTNKIILFDSNYASHGSFSYKYKLCLNRRGSIHFKLHSIHIK